MNLQKAKCELTVVIVIFLGLKIFITWRDGNLWCPTNVARQRHNNVTTCTRKILYVRPSSDGRLGNRLMEYASAWVLAQQHNLTVVISDNIASSLQPSFERLSLPSRSEYTKTLRPENVLCVLWIELQIEKPPVDKGAVDVKKLLLNQSFADTPPAISPYMPLKDVVLIQRSLRQEMHQHSNLSQYVHNILQGISQNLKKNISEVLFIGVHVRLMDYPQYIRRGFGKNSLPVDKNYYSHATDYIIERFDHTDKSNIVFLVVSDDMRWSTLILIPALKNHLSSRNWTTGTPYVQWSGSSSDRQDFALLSSCNHSIIAYGMYAEGAALLAGGTTVVYDIHRGRKGHRNTTAMNFANLIPEWTLLS